jgi:hypothetical protein
MELDDLRAVWNKSTNQLPKNNNIMEMICRDPKGPLSSIKKTIKYTLYLFPSAAVLFAGSFIGAGVEPFNNPVLLLVFLSLFSEYIFSLFNYFTIKKMENPAGNIRDNLDRKIAVLKLRNWWSLIMYMILFLLMPVWVELNIHLPGGSFHGLTRFNPVIRLLWYAVIFIPLFVIRRDFQRKSYDPYLEKLKELVQQMD